MAIVRRRMKGQFLIVTGGRSETHREGFELNASGRFGKLAGSIARFVVGRLCVDGASSVAQADNIAYMTTNTGDFGTIDLNTGVFSLLGNSSQSLAGLGVYNGTLYGTSYHGANGTLYKINLANGSLTSVGSSTITYGDFGSTTTGLYCPRSRSRFQSIFY